MTEQTVGKRQVYLDSVGCRLNQAEIEQMARQFTARGDTVAGCIGDADLVIVNTCAVTNEATRKSRQMIRQAGRANPQAEIVATGCYAELDPRALAALPGVTHVIGNAHKDRLVACVTGDTNPAYDREPLLREPLPPGTLGRTRAFVKVQDGCDNRCTFCVTTLARGPARSRSLHEIVDEVNLLAALGYREAVLTGVHLGSYGQDTQDSCLARLVEALLERTCIPRLRLSSLEPWDLAPGFFDLWSDPRLCAHLHLPLQSGCDSTLRRMARRTTQASFAALVEAARARIANLALTTDVMVGFPGETDAEFEESLRYVERIGFARLHVFPYSARPGTAAAHMPGQVPDAIKNERKARMIALSDQMEEIFQQRHIGQTVQVLWESAHGATPDGIVWSGLTSNYLRVVTTTPALIGNTITSARLVGLGNQGMQAVVLMS